MCARVYEYISVHGYRLRMRTCRDSFVRFACKAGADGKDDADDEEEEDVEDEDEDEDEDDSDGGTSISCAFNMLKRGDSNTLGDRRRMYSPQSTTIESSNAQP
jgi:hypothetical protein